MTTEETAAGAACLLPTSAAAFDGRERFAQTPVDAVDGEEVHAGGVLPLAAVVLRLWNDVAGVRPGVLTKVGSVTLKF